MAVVNKTYRMPNYELCGLVNNIISFMTRDNVEFTARGVTVAMRNAFKSLNDAFGVYPSDEEYLGIITELVAEKQTIRDTTLLMIQKISGYFEQKWGLTSGKYKRLGIAGLQKMKELEYIFRAREVARLAEEFLGDLTPIGLTQGQIDDLRTECDSFQTKLIDISSAKGLREDKTEERTIKGNEIYALAVEYARVGKLIWENVSESKYNDYIIYETSHPGLSKPQGIVTVWDPVNSKIVLSWDEVQYATRYEVFYSIVNVGAPSGNFNLLNTYGTSPQELTPMSNKRNYYKIKAKNDSQASEYSEETWKDCIPV